MTGRVQARRESLEERLDRYSVEEGEEERRMGGREREREWRTEATLGKTKVDLPPFFLVISLSVGDRSPPTLPDDTCEAGLRPHKVQINTT